MQIRGLPGVDGRAALRDYVLSRGCFSPEENLRIYETWFSKAPRYLFRAVDRKYGISSRVLCDVGCAFGMNLVFCPPGSYGIDMDEREVAFVRSLGLQVHRRDVVQDDLRDLPRAQVVWCSALLEHVDAPHILLRKLYNLLEDGGLAVVYVPTIPLIRSLRLIPRMEKYFTGYVATDHINAFVPSTLEFTCERAGFKTLEVSPFYPGVLGVLNRVPFANRLIDGCVYVGRKIPSWEYVWKATRRVADNERGYVRAAAQDRKR